MLALTPQSIPLLCQTLLAGLTAAYLLALRSPVRSTRWLALAMTGYAAYAGAFFLSSALPVASLTGLYAVLVLYFAIGLTVAALVQVAYTFLADPFPAGRRRALVASGVTLAALAGLSVHFALAMTMPRLFRLFLCYGIALLVGVVWAVAVHARQYRRFQRAAGRGAWPPSYDARGHLAFGLLAAVLGLIGLANLLVTLDAISLRTFQYVALLGGLALSLGYVVAFINHAREPTTVQAKLVGLVLATVLAFLGLAGVRLFHPNDLAREAGNALPTAQTLRFTPLEDGGYKVAALAPPVALTASADTLAPRALTEADLAEGVALPFAFPFFGDTFTRAFPNPHGALHFEPPLARSFPFRQTDGPMVAALLGPSSAEAPSARAVVALEPEAAVFTWQHAYEFTGGTPASLQITLRPDGSVGVRYAGPATAPTFGLRGLWPGAAAAAAPVRFGPEALLVEPGTGVLEDFAAAYRAHAHAEVEPLTRIVLFAAVFVLVVLPLFFRASLLQPLERLAAGARRLEQGERTARVQIHSSDELGTLADGFNRMADAVEQADRQLKAYAEDLERRVAERTASLQQALDRQQAMQAQLVQAEKLASLGQLTAGIAHEIKNPLNFVTNFATLSQDYVDELRALLAKATANGAGLTDEERAEVTHLLADLDVNVAKIEEHGRRADGIVRGMLLHARGGQGERQRVDLNVLVEEFLGLAYHGMRARHSDFQVTLERDLAANAGTVSAVPQDLGRVLLNLLGNAFEAVRATASRAAPATPTVRLATRREADRVVVRVSDNGPGIPPEVQHRVFEPFFTTKPTGEGTGLGLSISHDIARSHGGTLSFESSPAGTTFEFALPASVDTPLAPPSSP